MLWVVLIIAPIVIYESFLSFERMYNHVQYYKLALARSKLLNKPLMVIGEPSAGYSNKIFGPMYGCGDILLDIKIESQCNSNEGDIQETLPTYGDNSHIIFISYTLEYVDDLESLIPHILRVSGGWENVIVIHAKPWSIWTQLYKIKNHLPGINTTYKNIIPHAPPMHKCIKFY